MNEEFENGYIKVHRSFLRWEWHDDQSTVTVFLHCLLLANWEPKRWHGKEIARGSFITSAVKLSKATGLSRQTVSKCLRRLQETGELTIEKAEKYSVITVNHYDKYQDEKTAEKTPPVNTPVKGHVKGHVNFFNKRVNMRVNTTEEYKEVKEEKKQYIYLIVDYLNEVAGTKYRPTSDKTKALITARLNEGFTLDDFKTVIKKKVDEWSGTDMAKYIRPETLFGTKFEAYLNQKPVRSMPEWYNPEPVRQSATPATAEEIAEARAKILKGKVKQ